MRFLLVIKPAILFLGGFIGLVVGGRQIWIYLNEKEPAAFTAENFAAQYAGQQWVSVTGRVAVEARSQMPNNGRPGWVSLYAPLVPQDWQRQDPVHVVVSAAAMPAGRANGWRQNDGAVKETTVTGMIRPLGGLNYAYVFPGLKFSRPTITINENTKPHAPWMMSAFVAICLIVCTISGWRISLALRA
jgi:hypothetical protein